MKGGGANSKSQWHKKKGHKNDKHGSPTMKDSFTLVDEPNEAKRVDNTLQWSAAFTGMLAEQFGQEVAKAFEDQNKGKLHQLLYGSSANQVPGPSVPISPAHEAASSRSKAPRTHELTLADLNISGIFPPVQEIPTTAQDAQAAHEAATSSGYQYDRRQNRDTPTLEAIEGASTETLLKYCNENNIRVRNEQHTSIMMAVVRHVLQRQQEEAEYAKAQMESTQPIRSQSSHSSMMREDESLDREREKVHISIQVKKEMENREKVKRIMGKMWNSLWHEFKTKLQRDGAYMRAVEALDILGAFKIIIEYNLYGINSTRDDRDPSVIMIRDLCRLVCAIVYIEIEMILKSTIKDIHN